MSTPILAESVSLNGGELLLILVVVGIMLLTIVVVGVLGCVWAYRAGKGSRASMVGAGVVGGAALVSGVAATVSQGLNSSFLAFALLGLQCGLYFLGTRKASSGIEPGPT